MISEIERQRMQLEWRSILLARDLELAREAVKKHNADIAEFNRKIIESK